MLLPAPLPPTMPTRSPWPILSVMWLSAQNSELGTGDSRRSTRSSTARLSEYCLSA